MPSWGGTGGTRASAKRQMFYQLHPVSLGVIGSKRMLDGLKKLGDSQATPAYGTEGTESQVPSGRRTIINYERDEKNPTAEPAYFLGAVNQAGLPGGGRDAHPAESSSIPP